MEYWPGMCVLSIVGLLLLICVRSWSTSLGVISFCAGIRSFFERE